MSAIKSYKDLLVWQKAVVLLKEIYQVSRTFPKEEIYGITSQLRRAALSVISNIAEGHARRSTKEYLRFISIAYGSLAEAEAQLIVCFELGYITSEVKNELDKKISEIGKMMNGLIRALEGKLPESRILTPESSV